jgi:hypothetical protein
VDSTDAELMTAVAASTAALRALHQRHAPWLRARLVLGHLISKVRATGREIDSHFVLHLGVRDADLSLPLV